MKKLFFSGIFIPKIPAIIATGMKNGLSVSLGFGEKVRLQSFVFPDGILYDKENNRVRTTSVNSIFEISRYLSENYGHKKSGILSKKDLNSTVVDLSVLISNFFNKHRR